MAFRQSGYSNTRRVAERHDDQLDRVRDRPAKLLAEPTGGTQSRRATSAVGVPGYYASQRGLTRETYRRLAAIAANTDTINNTTWPWYEAQGMTTDEWTRTNGAPAERDKMVPVPSSEAPALRGFKVSLEKEDVAYLETIRREKQAEEFDQWLVRNVDMSVPENQRWLQEIHPTFFSRRESYIDDKINLEARLAKIRLRGFRSEEDLKLLYAVQTGLIKPPTGPMFGTAAGGENFTKGWFSVLGYLGRSTPRAADGTALGTDFRGLVPAGVGYDFTARP